MRLYKVVSPHSQVRLFAVIEGLGTRIPDVMASQEKREFDKYLKFLTFKVLE